MVTSRKFNPKLDIVKSLEANNGKQLEEKHWFILVEKYKSLDENGLIQSFFLKLPSNYFWI